MRPKKNIGSTGIFWFQRLFPMITCFESGMEMEKIFEVMSFIYEKIKFLFCSESM